MAGDGVAAEFFVEAVPDYAASAAAGRPIHRDVERVRIVMPAGSASLSGQPA